MAKTSSSFVKVAGTITLVLGAVFLVSGAGSWAIVTNQLASENITVPDDADMFAGEKVRGPLTAYSQAATIKKHINQGSGGLTYAELGGKMREAEAAGDTEAAEKYEKMHETAMTGSFLRASLFTSVLAYGVSALVMGLGVLQIVAGLAFRKIGKHS